MLRINKSDLIFFILGAIIFGTTSVVAASFIANNITYSNAISNLKDSNNQNIDNVQDAIDIIYGKIIYGDATAQDIINGKKALVNGNPVVGQLVIPNYTTLSNTENLLSGSSTTGRTGYYYLDNYNVSCASCDSNVLNWSLMAHTARTSHSVTINHYYFIFSTQNFNTNGATNITSIVDVGAIRNNPTYGKIVKATSATITSSINTFIIEIGYE